MENWDLSIEQADLEVEIRKAVAEKQKEDWEQQNELSPKKRQGKDDGSNVGKPGYSGPSIPSSSGPSTSAPSYQDGGPYETSSSRNYNSGESSDNSGESSDNKDKDQLFWLNLILNVIKMFFGDDDY